ncbi:MAG: hypothetical protein AAF358_03105 [Pseudomonadota bacterium]
MIPSGNIAWFVNSDAFAVSATTPKMGLMLEEIVMTAQKRVRSLQAAPDLIAAVTVESLESISIA